MLSIPRFSSALNLHSLQVALPSLLQRLGANSTAGLTEAQVKVLLKKYGPNAIQPPQKNWFKTIMEWLFSGFGSILWIASLLCFLAWEPLGEPNPQAANLGLYLFVFFLSTLFRFTH